MRNVVRPGDPLGRSVRRRDPSIEALSEMRQDKSVAIDGVQGSIEIDQITRSLVRLLE